MPNFTYESFILKYAKFPLSLVGAVTTAGGKFCGGWSLMSCSICVQVYRLLIPLGGQHRRFQQNISIYSGFPKTTFLNFMIHVISVFWT